MGHSKFKTISISVVCAKSTGRYFHSRMAAITGLFMMRALDSTIFTSLVLPSLLTVKATLMLALVTSRKIAALNLGSGCEMGNNSMFSFGAGGGAGGGGGGNAATIAGAGFGAGATAATTGAERTSTVGATSGVTTSTMGEGAGAASGLRAAVCAGAAAAPGLGAVGAAVSFRAGCLLAWELIKIQR